MEHDAAALDALVTQVVDTRREIARLQSVESRLLAGAVDIVVARIAERSTRARRIDRDIPMRDVSAELGAAMRLTDRTVQSRMGDATELVERFAATLAAWERGDIDAPHVSAILDSGAAIADDDLRADYERRVLEVARSETPGRLRPAAKAIAAAIDPETTRDLQRGHDARRVRVDDLPDGMARLIADLPAPLAYAILDRLTEMARGVRAAAPANAEDSPHDEGESADDAPAGPAVVTSPTVVSEPTVAPDGEGDDVLDNAVDHRTLDQLRADVFADLLLAGAPVAHGDGLGAVTAHIQVTIPVDTLAGRCDRPALLTNYGPIDPRIARRLATEAPGWDRVLTDAHTGVVLSVDRYRPSADLRRLLSARDERCRFPGCRRAARRCDVDHTHDAAKGGETSECNLCHLCRRHHTLKHATPWSVRQRGGGVIEWTSPTGRRYLDRPPAAVRFVPMDDPPPL